MNYYDLVECSAGSLASRLHAMRDMLWSVIPSGNDDRKNKTRNGVSELLDAMAREADAIYECLADVNRPALDTNIIVTGEGIQGLHEALVQVKKREHSGKEKVKKNGSEKG